ncbi:MAG: alpha/beta fold hydrolase [Proteobacteria bacterium]|nr:alpha/beta fold hydrolase [Pseudomonadota bacterium]MBU4582507.1 alpha/beta fold hydrolase [Pseudomonadota bacterium]MCG2740840.1 alpha/beta fold hydrolase [Syntrophaceae bacterium]
MAELFSPAAWARSAHLQTIFGSLRLRVAGKNEMVNVARETIVDAGNPGRLLGYHSRQTGRKPRGLVILIHGWEGSADSTYILSTGRFLYRQGYDIFRLNLWDHGKSHHLNRELFHGAMTEETAQAVANVARLLPDRPCYLIGFSLGGNFALRIALRQSISPIPNLKNVFCISPALDPHQSTLAIDAGLSIYRRYFLAKWKRSLRQKQRCFPDLYQFDGILHHGTCMALTEAIMPWYTEFGHYQDYFRRYTLTGDVLAPLAMPVTIFTAADDPVVSAEEFHRLPRNRYLNLSIQRYGGHCGFLNPFPFGCWYERSIGEIIAREEKR